MKAGKDLMQWIEGKVICFYEFYKFTIMYGGKEEGKMLFYMIKHIVLQVSIFICLDSI